MPNAQGFDYYVRFLGVKDGGAVKFHENNQQAGTTGSRKPWSDNLRVVRLRTAHVSELFLLGFISTRSI